MSPLLTWLVIFALAMVMVAIWRWALVTEHRVDDAIETLVGQPAAPTPVELGCRCQSCDDARDLIGLDDWLRKLAESGDSR